jgi:hypothetical protein
MIDIKKLFRLHDPDTSKYAAESIVDSLTLIQKDVLAFAKDQGERGFTDYELGNAFHNNGSTYRSRRAELTKSGMIVPTQNRRKMPSGRNAVVWKHREYSA